MKGSVLNPCRVRVSVCFATLGASEWYELGLHFVGRLLHLLREKNGSGVSPPPPGGRSGYQIAICEKLLLFS